MRNVRISVILSFVRVIAGHESNKWRRIEVVITSRTRNAVVLRGTWVRIPPSPPKQSSAEGAVLFWRRQRKGFEPGAGRRALRQDLLLHYSSCISGICNNRCHEGSIKTISSRFFLCRCLSSSQIAKSATVHLVLMQIILM